jgi:hypothetical protein
LRHHCNNPGFNLKITSLLDCLPTQFWSNDVFTSDNHTIKIQLISLKKIENLKAHVKIESSGLKIETIHSKVKDIFIKFKMTSWFI